jgi:DNA-directed RNA polymerase specialized sigma24 family protein
MHQGCGRKPCQPFATAGHSYWLEGCRGRCAGGLREFVQVRSRALLRSAWFMTGDWFLAEDRVQTALMHIWPRWERIASSA